MMSKRFVDQDYLFQKQSGFTVRPYGLPLSYLAVIFLIALVITSVSFLLPDRAVVLFVTLFILLSLFVLMFFTLRRMQHVISRVEFQNALFAGAARISTEFCMIVKEDGTVVYVDPEYNRKFFHLNSIGATGIKALRESGGLSVAAEKKLFQALKEGYSEKVQFTLDQPVGGSKSIDLVMEPIGLYGDQGRAGELVLAVDPIARPSGYYFLRARKPLSAISYEEYADSLAVGYYALNSEGEVVAANGILEDILGYRRGGMMAHKMTLRHFMEDPDILEKHDNKSVQADMVLRHIHGERKQSYVAQAPIFDADKNCAGVRGIVIMLPGVPEEIAPVADMESEKVLAHLPVATAVLSDAGIVEYSNEAFRNIIGKPFLRGKNLSLPEIVTDKVRPEVLQAIKLALSRAGMNIRPIDIRITGEQGRSASLYIGKLVLKNHVKLVVHLIDTTELKNLEQRFVHSQKMQAVGQLAGGIAHDFNNLLTAMMGFCDLLLMKHPAGDQSFADIMQIKQNASRAANLVRQLLAFSRQQTLQPEVISITESLADLSNLIGRLIGENIELNMIHGRDLAYIKVDQGQFEQVIINLAVNARDAMSSGGVLTIRTSNVKIDKLHPLPKDLIPPVEDEIIEDGDYVLVEVMDTGCGISPDISGKIFEPFFSTKEVGSGTGLGLSTVYGIVKQTGGYIYVSSIVGAGTTFSIFLKSYHEEDKEVKGSRSGLLRDRPEPVDDLTGKGTILLVEDESPVRIFSASALNNKGYTVYEAENGKAALEIVGEKGDTIDLVITDVVMPGMNGPALIEKITERYPDVKVIFISGYAEETFMKTYGSERKFNFLPKPYTLKQLAAKVKEIMAE